MSDSTTTKLFRVLDANCNRLREALRIIEEYFRFISTNEQLSIELKTLRHSAKSIEQQLGNRELVNGRDTLTDPFSRETRPEEQQRDTLSQLLIANLKRGQEAARVIEEYAKLTGPQSAAQMAKVIRFNLYAFEKSLLESVIDG